LNYWKDIIWIIRTAVSQSINNPGWSLSGGAAQVSGGGGAMPRSTKLPAFSLHLSQPIPALRSLSLSVYSLVWSVEPALLRRSAKKKGCVLGQGAQ